MTPEQRRVFEKAREEANRRLHPRTPATEHWVTAGGIVLGAVILTHFAVPLPRFVIWPACVGLAALWLVNEFGARQAWRRQTEAQSMGARRVALKHHRDALARECLGRAYLIAAYSGSSDVFGPTTHWLLRLIAGAGLLYLCGLVFALVRVEAQMRAAGQE